MIYFSITDKVLENTRLLMPGPNGIGFLGQLSIDLLLSNLQFDRIGYLESDMIEPIFGTNCYNQRDSYTAFELYQSVLYPNITILQLRSNCIKGYGQAFCSSLAEWIRDSKFQDVVLLTGLDKTRRNDAQLNSSPLRFLSNNEKLSDNAVALAVQEMEAVDNEGIPYKAYLPPGSGLTNFLLEKLKIPFIVLAWFTEVGDNSIPAQSVATKAAQLSQLLVKDIKVPESWEVLYGPETELRELF
jgi:hypothetical protein